MVPDDENVMDLRCERASDDVDASPHAHATWPLPEHTCAPCASSKKGNVGSLVFHDSAVRHQDSAAGEHARLGARVDRRLLRLGPLESCARRPHEQELAEAEANEAAAGEKPARDRKFPHVRRLPKLLPATS